MEGEWLKLRWKDSGAKKARGLFSKPSVGLLRFFPKSSRQSVFSRSKGFTLLEILAVMAIIAIVMSIALPRFGDVFQTNVKGAMRKFTGMVKFCFHESVIKQSYMRLMIDPMTGEYWPTIMTSSGSVGQFVSLTGSEVIQKKGKLPGGIRFVDIVTPHNIFKVDKDEAFISFFPTGFVERSVVHLGDSAGRFYTLVMQPLTGDVEIMDGYIDLQDTNETQGPFSASAEES